MSSARPVAYASVRTLFLDVGHTLIAPDFGWMARELALRGVDCSALDLRQADAALRPRLGAPKRSPATLEAQDVRASFLEKVLALLPPHAVPLPERRAELARALVPVLYPDGTGQRLWSLVMPGVREALGRFAELGLRMVVVSNADGSVERQLIEHELRSHFADVLDSHVVGVSKPDPAIFELALARSGAEPKHTLHVGDMYEIDVLGARSAGLEAVLLDPDGRWGERDCEILPDLLALAERLEHARGER